MKFRRGSGRPSYTEVEAPGQEKDGTVVIDPKQSFVMSDRRESEQKEGFIVPDQRERFLVSESSWPKLCIPEGFGTSERDFLFSTPLKFILRTEFERTERKMPDLYEEHVPEYYIYSWASYLH